jgi:hypothetical protein
MIHGHNTKKKKKWWSLHIPITGKEKKLAEFTFRPSITFLF